MDMELNLTSDLFTVFLTFSYNYCVCPCDTVKMLSSFLLIAEKKDEIWLSPNTNARTPTNESKKATWQHNNATNNFDYTTIADRLKTVSWRNDSLVWLTCYMTDVGRVGTVCRN